MTRAPQERDGTLLPHRLGADSKLANRTLSLPRAARRGPAGPTDGRDGGSTQQTYAPVNRERDAAARALRHEAAAAAEHERGASAAIRKRARSLAAFEAHHDRLHEGAPKIRRLPPANSSARSTTRTAGSGKFVAPRHISIKPIFPAIAAA